MPAAAFIKPLTSFVTKLAQNPKVQEAALDIGTTLAGDLTKRLLNRNDNGGPSARAQERSPKSMSMAPKNGNVPSITKQAPGVPVTDPALSNAASSFASPAETPASQDTPLTWLR